MAITMKAKDGREFGAFESANGSYVAAIDNDGFHRQPSSYESLPSWSQSQAVRELRRRVRQYEAECECEAE